MQIQSPLAAASVAAAAASQTASKDRASANAGNQISSAPSGAETVGRTEQASTDRDAQGGGEGLDHGLHRKHRGSADSTDHSASVNTELRATSPDPPSQLDIVG